MKIYVDFDDVICETARYFTVLAKELFNKEIPYESIQFFDLQKSFGISDEQFVELMRVAHLPEILLKYEENPGAVETLNKWVDLGYDISIITGRPFDSYEPSRKWLDEHNLQRIPLFCVDKYGREAFNTDCTYNMTLEKLYSLGFDFAVEDSPSAFKHLLHFKKCKVAVVNRPWNRLVDLPNDDFTRCSSWKEIDNLLSEVKETNK